MEEANKKYTAKDFARYHSGTMPAEKMHALEMAALEDPFLADALEGHLNTSDFEGDITELKARLKQKETKKNVFSISSITKSKWWRVAALIILFSGGSLLAYRLYYNKDKNILAKNEVKNLSKQSDSSGLLKDTITNNDNVAFQNPVSSKSLNDNIAPPKLNKEKERNTSVPLLQPSESVASNQTAINDKNSNSAEGKVAKDREKEYVLKGTVTDKEGSPLASASISAPTLNAAALTDSSGKFLLQSPDSNTTATVVVTGYSSKKVMLKKDEQPTIAMDKSDADLDEIVVNEKKGKLSPSRALQGKAAGLKISGKEIQPFSKNEDFEKYLIANMKPVFDEDGNRAKGEVVLSSTISKKGRPINIKIINSSCEACEEEAIRLLGNGPDWKYVNNKVGLVIIDFY